MRNGQQQSEIFILKKPIDTAPKINRGFEELEKDTSLSASCLEIWFSCLNLAVNFAPAGNPEAIPIAQTNPPAPGTLKTGRISGSKNTPIKRTTPIDIRISETIKKAARKEKQCSTTYVIPALMPQVRRQEKNNRAGDKENNGCV